MNYNNLKREAYEANLAIEGRNISIYSWAHASAFDRPSGLFAIKPSGRAINTLRARDMVVVDLEGRVVEGTNPSDDMLTHAMLYKELPAINGICPSHSPYTAGWAQAKRSIPIYGVGHSMHMPCDVPITEPFTRYNLKENYYKSVAEAILKLFASSEIIINGMSLGNVVTESAYIKTESALNPLEVPMVLVASDGSYSWGTSAMEAVRYSILLEEIAKTAFITEKLNPKVGRLDDHIIEKQFESKHANTKFFEGGH